MDPVLTTVLWLGGIGLLCGVALAIGARYFSVEEDPRVGRIAEALPGANCGGCGFAGCQAYAAAVAAGKAPPDRCGPGGAAAAKAVSAIMGLAFEGGADEPPVAFVKCGGDSAAAARRFAYNGIADCAAAAAVAGGDKSCPYGCLGYATCANACPVHAIEIVGGIARVREEICIGCGVCAGVCPRHVIEMVPRSARVRVFCNSKDIGVVVRKYCRKGCFGCQMCVREAKDGVIVMDGPLARVNYSVPFEGDAAPDKCPMGCLRRM